MAQYYQQLPNASHPVILIMYPWNENWVSFHLQIHLSPSKQFLEKKKKLTKTLYSTRTCIITPLGRTRQKNGSSSHMLQRKSTSFISVEELSVGTVLQLMVPMCSKNKILCDILMFIQSQSNFNFLKCTLVNILTNNNLTN